MLFFLFKDIFRILLKNDITKLLTGKMKNFGMNAVFDLNQLCNSEHSLVFFSTFLDYNNFSMMTSKLNQPNDMFEYVITSEMNEYLNELCTEDIINHYSNNSVKNEWLKLNKTRYSYEIGYNSWTIMNDCCFGHIIMQQLNPMILIINKVTSTERDNSYKKQVFLYFPYFALNQVFVYQNRLLLDEQNETDKENTTEKEASNQIMTHDYDSNSEETKQKRIRQEERIVQNMRQKKTILFDCSQFILLMKCLIDEGYKIELKKSQLKSKVNPMQKHTIVYIQKEGEDKIYMNCIKRTAEDRRLNKKNKEIEVTKRLIEVLIKEGCEIKRNLGKKTTKSERKVKINSIKHRDIVIERNKFPEVIESFYEKIKEMFSKTESKTILLTKDVMND